MAVNYSTLNLPSSITAGSTVGSGITNPLTLTIVPNDGYVVAADSFSISGGTGGYYNDLPNAYYYYSEGVTLPEGIQLVQFVDTATAGTEGNQVTVNIYVNETFEMPSNSHNFQLDIDGDATLIVETVDQTSNENTSNLLKLILVDSLYGFGSYNNIQYEAGNSNIVPATAVVVNELQDVTIVNPPLSYENGNVVSGGPELNDDAFTGVPVNTVAFLQDGLMYFDNTNYQSQILWRITPPAGFTINKNSFSIDAASSVTTDGWFISGTGLNLPTEGSLSMYSRTTYYDPVVYLGSDISTPAVGYISSIDFIDTLATTTYGGPLPIDSDQNVDPSDYIGNEILVRVNGLSGFAYQNENINIYIPININPMEVGDTVGSVDFEFQVQVNFNQNNLNMNKPF